MSHLLKFRLWLIEHEIRRLNVNLEFERTTTGYAIQELEKKKAKLLAADVSRKDGK